MPAELVLIIISTSIFFLSLTTLMSANWLYFLASLSAFSTVLLVINKCFGVCFVMPHKMLSVASPAPIIKTLLPDSSIFFSLRSLMKPLLSVVSPCKDLFFLISVFEASIKLTSSDVLSHLLNASFLRGNVTFRPIAFLSAKKSLRNISISSGSTLYGL